MLSSLKVRSAVRQELRCGLRTAILTVAAIALTWSTAALAQNEDKVKAGVAAWRNSGCSIVMAPLRMVKRNAMNRRPELICGARGSIRRNSSSQSVAGARAPECHPLKMVYVGAPVAVESFTRPSEAQLRADRRCGGLPSGTHNWSRQNYETGMFALLHR